MRAMLSLVIAVGSMFLVAERSSAQKSCCVRIEDSKAFYSDAKFIAQHDAPLPFAFVPTTGSTITFKTSGADGQGYLVSSPKKSDKYLLVFHEWWGLNGYIKQEAERLQTELGDVNILAVDLFDGVVATTPDQASKLAMGAKSERLLAIIQGAIDYAGNTKEIATLGWCYGGGWSLQAAFLAGTKCRACVMYYGMPDTTTANLNKLAAPVLGLFAGRDQYITKEIVATFQQAARKLGKYVEVRSYDADHAFANPSNPHFNQAAKSDADRRAIKFLLEQF